MAYVLVVDDEPMLRRTLRAILEKAGHTIAEAGDGDQALAMFGSRQPDLVLIDIIMPNREGVETIGEMRRRSRQIPIIAMSGGGSGDVGLFLKLASRLGANRTLAKPIRQADLLEAVDDCLTRQEPPPA